MLIPLFASFVGLPDGTYEFFIVSVTTDIETDCNHTKVQGCLIERDGILHVVAENPFKYDIKGCSILQHEVYHILGYEENEIPKCN